MALVGKGRGEPPEHLDDAKRRLRDGLAQIAAGRRDGADRRDRARASVAAQRLDDARTLVKFCKTARKIGGIAFVARHLFETAAHLAQGFRPAGGGICHDRDVIAHVAEIFCNGDARIDGRLARRHGHIGGVGDEHGALHQRFARLGVFEFGEFVEDVRHLVAALAAADVDDDIRLRPLRELVLDDRLAAAEGPGDCCHAAAGDGKEGVDDALARDHGLRGRKLLAVRPPFADGPLAEHTYLLLPRLVAEDAHRIGNGELALFDGSHFAVHAVGHEDAVGNDLRLLHGTEDIALFNDVARLDGRDEVPFALSVEAVDGDAARNAVAALEKERR